MITVSAPGKLMLLGEHAVVYGYPCIVTAIDERLKLTATNLEEQVFELEAADVDVHGYKKPLTEIGKGDIPKGAKFTEIALKNFTEKYPIQMGVLVETSSEFSSQFGFGSSSAAAVCAIKAFSELFGANLSQKEIFDIAYKTVLDIQGVGSGFDVAASIWGGTLSFVTCGKVIEPLNIKDIPLIVSYTGVKADTTALISQVAQKKENDSQKVDRIFQGIAKLTEDAKRKLVEGDWERVGKYMDFNQEYLRDLGVSSEKLETLISAAKGAGAWGAKLSGAGGGDCMVALASSEKRTDVISAITQVGGVVVDVSMGAVGVRVETTDDQEELLIIVDSDDKIVGFKTRYTCHHNLALMHRTVGVLLWNDKGQLLIQKRSNTKDMEPGLWGISSAGHVTKGQTDEEAAHRELQEELGVDVSLTFVKKFFVKNSQESERAVVYKGIHNGPFTPNSQEITEIKFIDPVDLRRQIEKGEIILTSGALTTLKEIGVFP